MELFQSPSCKISKDCHAAALAVLLVSQTSEKSGEMDYGRSSKDYRDLALVQLLMLAVCSIFQIVLVCLFRSNPQIPWLLSLRLLA